jgi:hypothetical protein
MGADLTLGEMAKALNRSAVYLRGLQSRLELPLFEGSYSGAYLAFLQGVVFLRTLNIAEENIRDLWFLEKKLLQLLHADSTGSRTWFLDACGQTTHRKRRLLLTNYDLGIEVPSRELQLGLDFDGTPSELFTGVEMGEDALRVLADYLHLYRRICADIEEEIPLVRATIRWAKRKKPC